MGLDGKKITGIRVMDVTEESANAIEAMVNQAIEEVHNQKIEILDIQITEDKLILILGEKLG